MLQIFVSGPQWWKTIHQKSSEITQHNDDWSRKSAWREPIMEIKNIISATQLYGPVRWALSQNESVKLSDKNLTRPSMEFH